MPSITQAVIFASAVQLGVCLITAVALKSIWRVGYKSDLAVVRQDIGVLWLGRACMVWVFVAAFQLVAILKYGEAAFKVDLWSREANAVVIVRPFLSIANSLCLLIGAAHFEAYQGIGLAGARVHPAMRRVAEWWREPWLRTDLWFWGFPIAFITAFLPAAWYVFPDVGLSLFTAVFLLYGLYASFVGRTFTELQYSSVCVMIFIGLAQFGELGLKSEWFTGPWRWLWITVFKAMLCLLFIALVYTWIHQKAQHPRWMTGADGIIVFPPEEVIEDIGDTSFIQAVDAIDVDLSKLRPIKLAPEFQDVDAKVTTIMEWL